jgi:probable HAF family extracellular repeat protein
VWRNGTVRVLRLVFGDRGRAIALNDRGQVIGNSRAGSGRFHAFVWENGKMTDLGTLPGGKESQALAINERGQIIGQAETKTGQRHAVLWTLKR